MAYLSGLAGLGWAVDAAAVEPEVPVRIQVSLLDRVIPFDRNFAVRVRDQLSVAVIVDERDVDSLRVGTQLLRELGTLETLGGYRLKTWRAPFSSAEALSHECRRLQAGVVYFTPGIREPTSKLAGALQGLRVLSVGSMPEQVAEGLVLGSALRSGKPRVLVNLKQARAQDVNFRADFLRMAQVVG